MNNRLGLRLLSFLVTVALLLESSSAIALAENVPFFCGAVVSTGQSLSKAELLSGYFSQKEYVYRTDLEAIDFYSSTEHTVCIYDDGTDALFTSASGYYFGKVMNNTTTKLYSFLQTECGIESSPYGIPTPSVYKTDDGYWVLGVSDGRASGLFYINLSSKKCYYMSFNGLTVSSCFSDRYIMLYDKSHLIVIDRDMCEAQVFNFGGIELVPYFDESGSATLIINTKYGPDEYDWRPDFYKHNVYYYYSWQLASIYKIAYQSYDYVCYADKDSIIVETEFYFNKIQNNSTVWKIAKKDIINNYENMYSIQNGVLWQYGNGSSYYHTYLVPMEQPLMEYAFGDSTAMVNLAYTVNWGRSGRYSDCFNYKLTTHDIDHTSVFDQLTREVVLLYMYHRNHRIYNQNHVIWNGSILKRDLGGDYGVYNFIDESYYQRTIIHE